MTAGDAHVVDRAAERQVRHDVALQHAAGIAAGGVAAEARDVDRRSAALQRDGEARTGVPFAADAVAGEVDVAAADADVVIVDGRRETALHAGPEHAAADVPDVEAARAVEIVVAAGDFARPSRCRTCPSGCRRRSRVAAAAIGVVGVAAAQRAGHAGGGGTRKCRAKRNRANRREEGSFSWKPRCSPQNQGLFDGSRR